MRVGFVGLGSQGAPIAQRIADGGFDTVVWARRAEALEPFRGGPARIARTLTELGEGLDLLGTCVFDAAGTWEVLFGADGAARAMPRGAVIAVHSTVAPREVREIAEEAASYGLRVLDAPVSGGPVAAARGELVTMVGGDAQTIAECEPVFRCFSAHLIHLGAVGAGQQAKLLNNAMLAAHLGIAADVFALGRSLGLDPGALAAVLRDGSGRSFGVEMLVSLGGLENVATSQARPTLGKDVELLAELLAAGDAPPTGDRGAGATLLSTARGLIESLEALAAADLSAATG